MPVSISDFIHKARPAGPDMHLMHCTTALSTMKALEERTLGTTKCPVYQTDLLYMFYGRPAYKPAAGIGPSGMIELAPVCLILDPLLLGSVARVLPFDSGGFDRYGPLLGPGLKLDEFELGSSVLAPMQLVGAFYETNRNYYEQHPTLNERSIPVTRVTSRAYARLIADPSIRSVDDRCGTIELQFSKEVSLKTALKAVVGPAALLSDPDIQEALQDCSNAVPLPYKTYGRCDPLSFAQALYERVETFLTDQGQFA